MHEWRVVENEINIVRDQLIRNYVDVVVGTRSFIDPHQVLVTTTEETRRLSASKGIIAVGTKPGGRPYGGTVEYLRDVVFNYPTLAPAYKIAAPNGLNRMQVSPINTDGR